mgnify:CR=1 FL=1
MLVLKAGGRGDVTKSHVLWSFDSGPDVPTPVTDGTYRLQSSTIAASCSASTRAPARRSTAGSACARHLQRVAGAGRRQDLHHQRRRRDERRSRRDRSSRCSPKTSSTTTRSARRRCPAARSSSAPPSSSGPSGANRERSLAMRSPSPRSLIAAIRSQTGSASADRTARAWPRRRACRPSSGRRRTSSWKAAVPAGHSSPVLTRTQIFMTGVDGRRAGRAGARPRDRQGVVAARRAAAHERDGSRTSTGPRRRRPSPTASDVFAFFQDFGLVAYATDGKELWRLPLGPFNMFYGFGASPIVVDGTLILPVDQDTGSYLLGVDAKTGKQRYKIDRPGVISGYSTPTVYRAEGRRHAGPDPRVVPVVGLRREGRPPRVVGARPRVRDEVGASASRATPRYINGWGFSQNQPGHADRRRFRGKRA